MNSNPSHSKPVALLTGASGFVGSCLARRLIKEGWNVHLLVRKNGGRERISALEGDCTVHEFDGSCGNMREIFTQVSVDMVFHLAALVLVDHSPEDLENLICSNILLGTQVLEAMSQAGSHYFINTGSYWQHYKTEGYNPVNLYAATKQAFEDILTYYSEGKGIHTVTLKLFDVYGPGDTRRKFFSLLEKAFRTSESLAMSPGEQFLDLVYIDDVVEAYWQAAHLLRSDPGRLRKSYAVSSGKRITLKEVVHLYQKITGRSVRVQWGGRPYRDREVMNPWQGEALPGWKPAVTLETGIRRMMEAELSVGGSRD